MLPAGSAREAQLLVFEGPRGRRALAGYGVFALPFARSAAAFSSDAEKASVIVYFHK